MFILLPIVILILTAITLIALPRLRPGFSSGWILAVGGAFLAWVSIVAQFNRLPDSIALSAWGPPELSAISPSLLVDDISWPLALAIATIGLSLLLVDVRRAAVKNWSDSILTLAFTALGILAIFSANWVTLALFWSLLDLALLLILWNHSPHEESRRKLVPVFSANIFSIFLLLVGSILSVPVPVIGKSLVPSSSLAITFLIIAIGIRLGIVMLRNEISPRVILNRNLVTLFQLVSAAATMLLVLRIELFGIPVAFSPYQIVITLLAAVYGAVRWARAEDVLAARRFWIFGVGFLALSAALYNDPKTVLAWVLTLLYAGSFITFTFKLSRSIIPASMVLLMTTSLMPIIPIYIGSEMVANTDFTFQFVLILIQSFLLFGYLRQVLIFEKTSRALERWVAAIYYLGIAWLPLTYWGIFLRLNSLTDNKFDISFGWTAGTIVGITAMLFLFRQRKIGLPTIVLILTEKIFSFRWLIRLSQWGMRTAENFIKMLTALLEGEGGMLWAALLVALLATLLVQAQAGG